MYKHIFFLYIAICAFLSFSQNENRFDTLHRLEGPNEKGSMFFERLRLHESIYFGSEKTTHPYTSEDIQFVDYQISFRYELFDFNKGEYNRKRASRGFNAAYTQRTIWDLSSHSTPFFDSNYMPSFFFIFQDIAKNKLKWVHRLDIEQGYQHHSNGRASVESRSTEYLYLKTTLIWRLNKSFLFLSPRFQYYFEIEEYNADVADYWGYLDIELTLRTKFGLQVENHIAPAKNAFSFETILTYPMSHLIKPLKFYLLASYYRGAGRTFLTYSHYGQGFLFGVALSR